ncbi:UvrD-helicase domain-containing protein [Naasia aerilata]|uniref:UvrD-helicase domain-containing protein n=1 Tax=Naasia aerilata TaxID=1162966 RepID=UPI002573FC67|nr:ATP-dependent helicase [Naasia aerilata]
MGIRGFAPFVAVEDEVVLDDSQRAVLDLPADASAIVVGPPGSGKTTTLVELVAARVAAGWTPGELLVLSPARQAAGRLRDRIALRLGVPTGGPVARTAASVAFEIVRADAARTGEDAPRLLTGAEQDSIIGALLEGHLEEGGGPDWPEDLDADVRRLPAFRTELRELMARATESNLSPAALAELGMREGHPEWAAAARFAEEYQRVVDSFRSSSYDSGELLAEATALIRAGRAPAGPRLVLVDDAQELGSGTAELIAAWVAHGTAVLAFGDPDIASTGFRGGRSDLLARLGATLGIPSMPTLVLTGEHRADPAIARVTAGITARIGTAGFGTHRLRPTADDETGADSGATAVVRIEAPGRPEEIARLAHRLRELHVRHEVPWNRMAVIVRSGRLVPAFARGLAAGEVPTRTSLAARPLREEWAARHLVDAVSVAVGSLPFDAPTLAQLLLGPLGGIDAIALRRLRLALRHEELAGRARGRRRSSWSRRWQLPAASRLSTRRLPGAPATWRRRSPRSATRTDAAPPSRSCSGSPGSAAASRARGARRRRAPACSRTRPTATSTRRSPSSPRPSASWSARRGSRRPTSWPRCSEPTSRRTRSRRGPGRIRSSCARPPRCSAPSSTSSPCLRCRRGSGRTSACAERCCTPIASPRCWKACPSSRSTPGRRSSTTSCACSRSPCRGPGPPWCSPRWRTWTSSRRRSSG